MGRQSEEPAAPPRRRTAQRGAGLPGPLTTQPLATRKALTDWRRPADDAKTRRQGKLPRWSLQGLGQPLPLDPDLEARSDASEDLAVQDGEPGVVQGAPGTPGVGQVLQGDVIGKAVGDGLGGEV